MNKFRAGKAHYKAGISFPVLTGKTTDLLVTEDEGIHKKAKKIGIEDKVYSLSDANAFIEAKLPKSLKIDNLSPIIEPEWCYNININDSFFDSLRNDYIGFNNWFKNKCQSEHRQCFVVKEQDKLEGICIYKTEDSEESVKYGMKGFVVKLCTFKLTIKGRKLGELLLKNIFSTCYNANVDWIYVTAFENNYICQFFESFGFEKYKLTKKDTGELIFRKRLNPNQSDLINTPLDYHIKFGPRYFETSQNSFLVPIKTSYHEMLFPELERQPLLFANFYPYSNAIKKAYISNSNTTLVNVGDILFFYRTHKDQSIQACGIVEELRRSSNPEEVLALAGKRTLYELKDISEMCKNRECLVILFRQAENLVKPIYLSDLTKIQLIKGVPQSISKLTDEAKKYILSEGTKLKLIV